MTVHSFVLAVVVSEHPSIHTSCCPKVRCVCLFFRHPSHEETEPGWCPNNSNWSQDTAKIH